MKDPYEYNNLFLTINKTILSELLTIWHSYDNSYHISLEEPEKDKEKCCALMKSNGYVLIPFVNYDNELYKYKLNTQRNYIMIYISWILSIPLGILLISILIRIITTNRHNISKSICGNNSHY